MTIAESDGMRLAYIAEVTEGTTPATPGWQVSRLTSESIAAQKETVVSGEIRADKNIADILHVGTNVNGPVEAEFSYSSYDDWLESVFRGTWATDVLKNGIDRHSFSFEKTMEQGATDSFLIYKGVFIDSMSMSIQSKSIITASFGTMGLSASDATAAIVAGATYTAATTTGVMTSGNEVGTITVGAYSATILGIDLEFKSNNRGQPQVGSNDLAGIALGSFEVTGSLSLYFEDIAIYNAIRAHESVVLTINLGSTTLEKYTLVIPAAVLLDGDPITGGNGSDITFNVGFQGKYDSGEACSAKLTRGVA